MRRGALILTALLLGCSGPIQSAVLPTTQAAPLVIDVDPSACPVLRDLAKRDAKASALLADACNGDPASVRALPILFTLHRKLP